MAMMANMMAMVADTVAMTSSHMFWRILRITEMASWTVGQWFVMCTGAYALKCDIHPGCPNALFINSLSFSLSLWGAPCLKNQTCEKVKVKVFNFYLQALSSQAWSPKGRRSKEDTLPAEQQVGYEPGTFLSTCRAECLKCLAPVLLLSCHSQEDGCVTLQPSSCIMHRMRM